MFNKILKNTFSQIVSKFWTAIISIVLLNVLTNYLSIELFWLYSKVYNFLWIFAFLADLWLYTIAVREISKNENDSAKIIWNIMTLRLILWVVILFLALWIAYFLPWYNSDLALISIFIVWIFTIFSLLNSSILSLMQANLKMEYSVVSIISWKLLNVFLILLTVFLLFKKNETTSFDLPFILIIISWLAWIILNTTLNFFYARKIVKFSFWFDFDYIKHIFITSLPYWLALFLSMVYFKVDVIILSIIEPVSKSDLSIALYSLPMKIVEVVMVLGWFYLNSVLPTLTKSFEKKDYRDIQKTLHISFKILLSFSLFFFTLWILFRNYLIEIVANKDYLTALPYNSADAMIIVFWVVIFYFLSLLFIYVFIAAKKQSIMLKINIFITIFNIIWNILIIPKYSFIWSWIITLLSQIILFILCYIYSNKIIKFKIPIFFSLKIILLSILIFIFWNYLLTNYKIWLYQDLLIYWSFLSILYSLILFIIFRNNKKINEI